MASYKPADNKREEFRKYLEKAGVLDAFTKSLVKLYEENDKPSADISAIDYIKKTFNDETCAKTTTEIDMLKIQLDNLKTQLEKCKDENSQLKEKLTKYESLNKNEK